MRKLSYDFVKAEFERRGWTLLEESYTGKDVQMKCICPNGHEVTKSYDCLRQGSGCRICGMENTRAGRRHKPENVYANLRSHGYEPLSEYEGCKSKMNCLCPKGHNIWLTYDNFMQGKRCDKCAHIANADSHRFTIDQVRDIFSAGGCTLLSETYTGCHQSLECVCSCGRTSKIMLMDFKAGKRCSICGRAKMTKTLSAAGKVKSSTQQRLICSLVDGQLNFPWNASWLDVAFPNERIYIEYDGSGHDLLVKKKSCTAEAFAEGQKRRTYALLKDGWKEIRIVSKRDKLPNNDGIINMIEIAKMILDDGHSYVKFDIDKGTIEYNQTE